MKAHNYSAPDNDSRSLSNFLLGLQLQIGLFVSMAGIGVVDGGAGATEASSGSRQLIWGGMALLSLGYLSVTSLNRHKRRFSYGGWAMAALLIYVSASVLWSVDPVVTAKRAVLLAILVLICGVSVGYVDRNWRDETFSGLLSKPMGLILIIALLVTLFAPSYAFTDIGWRGMAGHKNEAGQMMAFATVLLIYGKCHGKLNRKARIAFVALTFGALIMAKSTTALLGFAFGVGVTQAITLRYTFNSLGSWKSPTATILLAISAVLFFAFQMDFLPSGQMMYSTMLDALGKSETFTGRTAIWDLVLGESRFHNPWIGGGYGAFWVGRESISGYVLTGGGVLYPGQSHNGYIDIYNDLGFIGLGLLVIVIIIWLLNAMTLLKLKHVEGKLHSALVFMCIFLNLGESTFLRGTGLMSIVFIASFVRSSAVVWQARSELRLHQGEREMLIY